MPIVSLLTGLVDLLNTRTCMLNGVPPITVLLANIMGDGPIPIVPAFGFDVYGVAVDAVEVVVAVLVEVV